eukprot:m.26839 g.26839  ORF g.26839 m.26839 type:complete len:707 (+) comp9998_c0_seq1:466-2586(+)
MWGHCVTSLHDVLNDAPQNRTPRLVLAICGESGCGKSFLGCRLLYMNPAVVMAKGFSPWDPAKVVFAYDNMCKEVDRLSLQYNYKIKALSEDQKYKGRATDPTVDGDFRLARSKICHEYLNRKLDAAWKRHSIEPRKHPDVVHVLALDEAGAVNYLARGIVSAMESYNDQHGINQSGRLQIVLMGTGMDWVTLGPDESAAAAAADAASAAPVTAPISAFSSSAAAATASAPVPAGSSPADYVLLVMRPWSEEKIKQFMLRVAPKCSFVVEYFPLNTLAQSPRCLRYLAEACQNIATDFVDHRLLVVHLMEEVIKTYRISNGLQSVYLFFEGSMTGSADGLLAWHKRRESGDASRPESFRQWVIEGLRAGVNEVLFDERLMDHLTQGMLLYGRDRKVHISPALLLLALQCFDKRAKVLPVVDSSDLEVLVGLREVYLLLCKHPDIDVAVHILPKPVPNTSFNARYWRGEAAALSFELPQEYFETDTATSKLRLRLSLQALVLINGDKASSAWDVMLVLASDFKCDKFKCVEHHNPCHDVVCQAKLKVNPQAAGGQAEAFTCGLVDLAEEVKKLGADPPREVFVRLLAQQIANDLDKGGDSATTWDDARWQEWATKFKLDPRTTKDTRTARESHMGTLLATKELLGRSEERCENLIRKIVCNNNIQVDGAWLYPCSNALTKTPGRVCRVVTETMETSWQGLVVSAKPQ